MRSWFTIKKSEAAVGEVLGQVPVATKKDTTIIGHLPQMASWLTCW